MILKTHFQLDSPLVVVDGGNSNRVRSRELGVKMERQKRAGKQIFYCHL